MRKAIENKTLMPIFVNGVMIPPGETRHFEDDQIPPEHRDEAPLPEPEVPVDPMAELAAKNAATVLSSLESLSADDLARLQLIEMEGKARKTVLEGIAAEGLKRAQSALDDGKEGDAVKQPDEAGSPPPQDAPAEKTEVGQA